MTAETTGAVPWPEQRPRAGARVVRPVAGVLADGTPYYAPIGEIVSDGTTVTCHLCGRSLKSVSAHLRVHGWTKAAYCEVFGLERGQALEGDQTSKRRAASFASRLIFDPAIREGSAAGRRRAASLAVISREAGLHKDWLQRHLAEVDPAAAAAVRQGQAHADGPRWRPAVTALGFPDVASYLRDRHLARRHTVRAISTELGMSHHAVAAALTRHGLTRTAHAGKRHAATERASQVAAGLGVDSVPGYVAGRRAAGWT